MSQSPVAVSGHARKHACRFLGVLAFSAGMVCAQQPEYVMSGYANGIAVYRVNLTTGALAPVPGSPFATPLQDIRIAADPQGRFVFATNGSANSVSAYALNAATGALTAVPGSPFAAGTFACHVVAHPSGQFLYVSNLTSFDVTGYRIDAATGSLAVLPGSPYKTNVSGFDIAIDPAGSHAFVGSNNGGIAILSIDPNTGAMAPVPASPFSAGSNLASITVHPNGRFVYAADAAGEAVYALTFDPTSGTLTAVPGSPYPSGVYPHWVSIHPNGNFLYVANTHGHDVSGYAIDQATGALAPLATSPFPAGDAPVSVTVDPAGQFAYQTNEVSIDVWAYSVNQQTGQLASAGSPLPVGAYPDSVIVVRPTAPVAPIIVPDHGGNSGSVTAQIIGSGFQSGATVKLTGSGQDILGTNTTVAKPSDLTTTFALTGAAPGVRNVVVTNPDSTTSTITGGFTVEQGGTPQISVSIVGRSQIRIGTPQTYYIVAGNAGNVDAPTSRVWIMFPTSVAWTAPDLLPSVAGATAGYAFVAFDASLNAGSSVAVPIMLTASGNVEQGFQIEVWKGAQ